MFDSVLRDEKKQDVIEKVFNNELLKEILKSPIIRN